MRSGGLVLVLAGDDDGEAGLVVDRLQVQGIATARLDTAEFPAECTVTAELDTDGWHGKIRTMRHSIDLAEIAAVFYGHPRPFTLPPGLSAAEERFARAEARFGLGGLLTSLPARWVPAMPGVLADSEYKVTQLAAAARCGLKVPPTVLTNDTKHARCFAEDRPEGAVYKALMHKVIADDSQVRLIYTSQVVPESIDERVTATMHQFQANLVAAKTADVRMLATRHGYAAVAIDTEDPAARQDFRSAYDALTYTEIEVPAAIASGCQNYLTALGLTAGVFDFCRTPEDWYFLECGAGARWAWLQEATGAPMAELLADALTQELP